MQNTGGVYFKNLDGLRAVAALSVIFYHCSYWLNTSLTTGNTYLVHILSFNGLGGELGVRFFFILSGFLITYLMFDEQKRIGTLRIGPFYVRRLLRIWPLYFLSIIIGMLVFPLISGQHTLPANQNSRTFLYLIFAANFDHIYNGPPSNGMLGVQWSVAVEEQFYLIWPLLFLLFGKQRVFPFFLVIGLVYSEFFFPQSNSGSIRYFHFISNFRFLAFGSLLAWLSFFHLHRIEAVFTKLSRKWHLVFYLLGITLLFFQPALSNWSIYVAHVLRFTTFAFFGFVILEQNFSSNSFYKIGNWRIFNSIGKISYGLYLFHMLVVYFLLWLFPQDSGYFLLNTLICVILTIFISQFSFTFFESYFLKNKSKFS